MSWIIDKQLDHLVSLAITQRLEDMARHRRDKRKDLAEQMGARGMNDSSVHHGSQRQIDAEAFDEAAQGIIDDVLRLFRNVYVAIPPESTGWIREKLDGVLDGVGRRLIADWKGSNLLTAPYTKAKRRVETELGMVNLNAKIEPPQQTSGFGSFPR